MSEPCKSCVENIPRYRAIEAAFYDLFRYIHRRPDMLTKDYACKECVGNNCWMVEDGFQCAYHEAVRLVEEGNP